MADMPLGSTFLPALTEDERRRRQLQSGDALRVLAMTLPQSLGPGAVAPDILLNAPGLAGTGQPVLPTGGDVAPPGGGGGGGMAGGGLAGLIAQAIVDQVTGTGSPGPLSGSRSPVPLPASVPTPSPASVPLAGAQSLSGVVRQEATAPSGRVTIGGASAGGSGPVPTPPRVLPRDPAPPVTMPTPQPVPTPTYPTDPSNPDPDQPMITTDPVPNLSDLLSLLRMDRTPRQRFDVGR